MINLLPAQHKQKLKQEETFRLVFILGVLFLVFLLCLALLLLSIRIYVSGEIRAQEVLVEAQRKEIGGDSPFQKIRGLNEDVRGLHNFYMNTVVFSDVIGYITQSMPQDVYLTSFLYTPASKNQDYQGTIMLKGVAATTEDLLGFRQTLEENSRFANFKFPFSNLVPKQEVIFSFEFELHAFAK